MYAVLARSGYSRLRDADCLSGVPVRDVRGHPGTVLHQDHKKLGRNPDGGGDRLLGRAAGARGRGQLGYDHFEVAWSGPLQPTAPRTHDAHRWHRIEGTAITIRRLVVFAGTALKPTAGRRSRDRRARPRPGRNPRRRTGDADSVGQAVTLGLVALRCIGAPAHPIDGTDRGCDRVLA